MIKKLTFLLFATMLMTSVMAEQQHKAFRRPVSDKSVSVKHELTRGISETTILTEDFSKFTAGTDTEPDYVRLDDANGIISDNYFNTPGWQGSEVYQAGGSAYIGFSEEYQETGIIITPLLNTSGAIYINCRIRTVDPAGDVVGYNIVDENLELLDANVDFFKVTNEWTNVSWFTSAGAEDSRIYIFAYSKNIFIDDIEVVSVQLPTPTLQEETNIGKDSFTANWDAVDEADSYIFKLTAEHTATADETFYYTNTSFDNVASRGTINDPEILIEMEATVENWFIYMPAMINEAIGFTGKYASSGAYGSISSPVFDLSSNNGKINISFKALSDLNEELIVSLITSEYGYYDVADQKSIIIEKEGWNEYSIDLSYGTEDAYVEITNFGFGNVFFDDLKLSQTIKGGETKTLIIDETVVTETSHKSNIKSAFLNDGLSYQVAARKNIYSSNDNIIGTIDSKFTEAKTVDLISEEIALDMISIGEGDINTYYAPISNYGSSNFSISQQIYTKDEINKESGTIKSISFHNKNGNSNTRNITVYMSNTIQDSYRDSHDWVEIEESQIVFKGDFTFGAQDEWTTIELQNAFVYNGSNLAISIYDASESNLGYSGNHDTFYSHATDTLRGLYKTSSEKINVYNIIDELYCYELKTSIYTTPANQYYVNDIQLEFGQSTVEYPSVPQNLSANAIDESSISLSWTSAQNATSYNVYRGTEKLANVTTTSYLAEDLTADTEYCFTITALNGDAESEKSAEACAKTKEQENQEEEEDDNDGLNELSSSLNVYPNPVNDKLYIEAEVEIENVTVYTITGVMVGQQTTSNGQQTLTLDLSELNSGIYFVKISTDKGEVVKKIVKNI